MADDAITDAKLRNSAATSVIGRSAGTSGDPADIAAGSDGHYLRRSGGTLGFGVIAAPDLPAMDAESNVNITLTSKVWLEAARCQNATATLMWDTPTTNPALAACVTGTNTQKGVADFADGANSLSLQRSIALPSDWTGNIDVKFKWFSGTTTGDVVWQIAAICTADAETDDAAFATASTVTDTAKGTANQLNDATITGWNVVTNGGCAAGELMHVKIFRDPTHASDTHAATARLIGVELTLRRAQ